jgi:hypothetical protein
MALIGPEQKSLVGSVAHRLFEEFKRFIIRTATSALKAQNMTAQGNALGPTSPKQFMP